MLYAIAPVRLGAVERPIGFRNQSGEILIRIRRNRRPDADGYRWRVAAELQRCDLEVATNSLRDLEPSVERRIGEQAGKFLAPDPAEQIARPYRGRDGAAKGRSEPGLRRDGRRYH